MSTPDIRVRLSPEGVKEVLDALRTVQTQAERTTRATAGGFSSVQRVALQLRNLLPAIGLAGVTAGVVALTRSALAAADATGKLAQQVGATAEGISVLQFAASTADVSTEQLGTGLTRLSVSLGNLEEGSKGAVQAFGRLGLAAKDFAGLDTVQSFDLIAQRLGKVGDSTRKTQIAVEIFGKSGAQLIPLLNDLAANGFGSVEEAARSLGLVIDTETANAAQQVNDSFTLIKQQAQGLAVQFISGLAPSVLEVMTSFREETAGKGVASIREFGAEVGRVLRVVIATFRTFYDIVTGIFSGIGTRIGELAAIIGAISQGEFGRAVNIWRDADEQSRADYERFKAQVIEDVNRISEEATKEVKPIEVQVRPKGEIGAGTDESAERAAAAAARQASTERQNAEREAARLAAERHRAEEAAGRARFDLEQRLLELTGRQREARLRALDEELAKQREILAAAGGVTPVDEARFTEIRRVEVARIDFEETVAEADRALETLAQKRERIQQDVELGITTEREGQRQIAALELERLPVMEQLAAAALAAAQASGDPALIAQAEDLNLRLRQIQVSTEKASSAWLQFKEQATDALAQDFTNWLTDGIEDVDSLGEAFRKLGDTILQTLQRILVERFIQPQIEGLIDGALTKIGGLGGIAGTAGGATPGAPGTVPVGRTPGIVPGPIGATPLPTGPGGLAGGVAGVAGAATGAAGQGAQEAAALTAAATQMQAAAAQLSAAGQAVTAGGQAVSAGANALTPAASQLGTAGQGVTGAAGQISSASAQLSAAAARVSAAAKELAAASSSAGTGGGGGSTASIVTSFASAFGYAGGGVVDARRGGRIVGPGTGTSDSIRAITTSGRALRLSAGEFIVKAAVVRQPGMLETLHRLNGSLPMPARAAVGERFATGGYVGGDAPAVAGMVVNQNFHISSSTGRVDRTSQQQVAASAARGLADAARRNN